MPKDKKILYALSLAVPAVLLCILLLANGGSRPLAAVWLALSSVALSLLLRKRRALSLVRKTVLLLLSVIGLLYISLLYLSGLYFGYIRATVPFTLTSFFAIILPCALIIAASEQIRRVLLAQESRLATVCAFLIGVLGELALAVNLRGVTHFNALMDLVALTLFPALTANLFYHYTTARHGALPSTVYRLLVTLYPYIIASVPAVPDVLTSFIKLLLPLLLLLFLRALFEKRQRRATERPYKRRLGIISATAAGLLAVGLILLISCKFRYGTIVIATDSMTGSLNVGDAIIYERYDNQLINTGQIVVFKKGRSLIVHRVVDIERINGQTRYYTKGDANEDRDLGFITDNDIVGITDFKISGIGYPAIWLQRIFEIGS